MAAVAQMATIAHYPQRLQRWVNSFFEAPENPGENHDPLFDIVQHYPDEAIWFIKVVMFFGSLSGVCIAIPCGAFLFMYWTPCGFCNRPLRYWILIQCLLQLVQAPVRLAFFVRLCHVQRNNGDVQECVRKLTHSSAWRASKVVSIVTYGWFILGVVWLLNSSHCETCPGLYRLALAVIFTAVARLLMTLIVYYHSFPPRFRQEFVGQPKGARQSLIDSLLVEKFCADHEDSQTSCAVCLDDFEQDDIMRRLPCGHCFHMGCIDKWLKRNKLCPLCLQDISVSKQKAA